MTGRNPILLEPMLKIFKAYHVNAGFWENFWDLKRDVLLSELTIKIFSEALCEFCDSSAVIISCITNSDGKFTSLDQYISSMKSGQNDISPFLERLKKKGYEVWSWNSLAQDKTLDSTLFYPAFFPIL